MKNFKRFLTRLLTTSLVVTLLGSATAWAVFYDPKVGELSETTGAGGNQVTTPDGDSSSGVHIGKSEYNVGTGNVVNVYGDGNNIYFYGYPPETSEASARDAPEPADVNDERYWREGENDTYLYEPSSKIQEEEAQTPSAEAPEPPDANDKIHRWELHEDAIISSLSVPGAIIFVFVVFLAWLHELEHEYIPSESDADAD